MKQHIYADNAATTQMDKAAFDAMVPWLLEQYGNASQPYAFSREPKKALAEARATIANCIGANPDEIFFTSGGTESDNWVIKSSAFSDCLHRATITSSFEHHAVLKSCALIERLGYPVAYVYPTKEGQILPEALSTLITNSTRLVSIMLANNEIGSIQPIKSLCDIAHQHGALFHTDAVQAIGHIKVDVHELGVDYLSASAHKFNGPKGIGFLYIRSGTELLPFSDGGSQEKGYRAGTENIASIVGMSEALRRNCDSIEANIDHIGRLDNRLITKLRESGIEFWRNGSKDTLPGLLSLSFPGRDGETILHRLDLMGISISTGAACDSENTKVSHVLQAISLDEDHAKGTVRISLGKNNTIDDIDQIVSALVRVLS